MGGSFASLAISRHRDTGTQQQLDIEAHQQQCHETHPTATECVLLLQNMFSYYRTHQQQCHERRRTACREAACLRSEGRAGRGGEGRSGTEGGEERGAEESGRGGRCVGAASVDVRVQTQTHIHTDILYIVFMCVCVCVWVHACVYS